MIRATVKEDGFEGVLYPAGNRYDKVMIVVSGSNGGIKLTKQFAQVYREHGIPALAVAFFGTKQTGKYLDRVPLEYIENAIKWLKARGYNKIGIDGASKGSELALLSASIFPRISCVIARVPSYFVSEGLVASGKSKNPSGTSCWSYKGEELPYAAYNYRSFNLPKIIAQERELHLITINKEKTVKDEDIIPVEKIGGPILLLSGKNDVVWPSYESSVYIEKRLEENGFKFPHKHVAFEYIGHVMTDEISWVYKIAFKDERRYTEQCKNEREQLVRELIEWTEKVW